MKKKHLVIVGVIILSAIVILGLYQTFALSSDITKDTSGYYNVTITDGTTITVPAGSTKTVYYKLTNTNKGIVKYGVGYSGTNITVKYYTDTIDPVTGTVDYGKSKYIKLSVENTGTTSSTATLSTILGYENGGDLIVPSGVTLVTEEYKLYTISYNLNGLSATEISSQLKKPGDSITIADISNTKFYGWAVNQSDNVPTYFGGDTFSLDTDVTFYAVYRATTRGDKYYVIIKINKDGTTEELGSSEILVNDSFSFSLYEETDKYKYSYIVCDTSSGKAVMTSSTSKISDSIVLRSFEPKDILDINPQALDEIVCTIKYTKV